MLDGAGIGVCVQVRLYLIVMYAVKTGQPLHRTGTGMIINAAIDLGPVTGGQQDGLVDAFEVPDGCQGLADTIPGEYDPLAYFYRRRVMVQPEYLERHSKY